MGENKGGVIVSNRTDEKIEVSRESSDFWFAMVDIDIMQDTELSPMARYIYAIICTYASKMGGRFWPGIERVADTADVDIEIVRTVYRELEEKGILSNAKKRCIDDEEG